jgi:hypothetical protein
LKQVGKDDAVNYSNIVSAGFDAVVDYKIYPNPVSDILVGFVDATQCKG